MALGFHDAFGAAYQLGLRGGGTPRTQTRKPSSASSSFSGTSSLKTSPKSKVAAIPWLSCSRHTTQSLPLTSSKSSGLLVAAPAIRPSLPTLKPPRQRDFALAPCLQVPSLAISGGHDHGGISASSASCSSASPDSAPPQPLSQSSLGIPTEPTYPQAPATQLNAAPTQPPTQESLPPGVIPTEPPGQGTLAAQLERALETVAAQPQTQAAQQPREVLQDVSDAEAAPAVDWTASASRSVSERPEANLGDAQAASTADAGPCVQDCVHEASTSSPALESLVNADLEPRILRRRSERMMPAARTGVWMGPDIVTTGSLPLPLSRVSADLGLQAACQSLRLGKSFNAGGEPSAHSSPPLSPMSTSPFGGDLRAEAAERRRLAAAAAVSAASVAMHPMTSLEGDSCGQPPTNSQSAPSRSISPWRAAQLALRLSSDDGVLRPLRRRLKSKDVQQSVACAVADGDCASESIRGCEDCVRCSSLTATGVDSLDPSTWATLRPPLCDLLLKSCNIVQADLAHSADIELPMLSTRSAPAAGAFGSDHRQPRQSSDRFGKSSSLSNEDIHMRDDCSSFKEMIMSLGGCLSPTALHQRILDLQRELAASNEECARLRRLYESPDQGRITSNREGAALPDEALRLYDCHPSASIAAAAAPFDPSNAGVVRVAPRSEEERVGAASLVFARAAAAHSWSGLAVGRPPALSGVTLRKVKGVVSKSDRFASELVDAIGRPVVANVHGNANIPLTGKSTSSWPLKPVMSCERELATPRSPLTPAHACKPFVATPPMRTRVMALDSVLLSPRYESSYLFGCLPLPTSRAETKASMVVFPPPLSQTRIVPHPRPRVASAGDCIPPILSPPCPQGPQALQLSLHAVGSPPSGASMTRSRSCDVAVAPTRLHSASPKPPSSLQGMLVSQVRRQYRMLESPDNQCATARTFVGGWQSTATRADSWVLDWEEYTGDRARGSVIATSDVQSIGPARL